jgi:hypothetical protein
MIIIDPIKDEENISWRYDNVVDMMKAKTI